MDQSFILSAKIDCPVACLNFPPLATAHDCESGLLTVQLPMDSYSKLFKQQM